MTDRGQPKAKAGKRARRPGSAERDGTLDAGPVVECTVLFPCGRRVGARVSESTAEGRVMLAFEFRRRVR